MESICFWKVWITAIQGHYEAIYVLKALITIDTTVLTSTTKSSNNIILIGKKAYLEACTFSLSCQDGVEKYSHINASRMLPCQHVGPLGNAL